MNGIWNEWNMEYDGNGINKIDIYNTEDTQFRIMSSSPSSSSYHFSSEPLIQSCPLPKTMISHKGRVHSSLTISAAKIEPLSALLKRNKKHMEYQITEQLIECIGRQLQHLERENKGISSFNIDDITVFHANDGDETMMYFAITNDEKIHEINDDNNLEITAPYPKEYTDTATATTKNKAFHSPEFKEFISKKTLPYNLHFKSGYYSFGLLCLYCYVSRTPPTQTDKKDVYDATLAPILNTKIYWFLKQVLQENPIERRYICV